MQHRWLALVPAVLPTILGAQTVACAQSGASSGPPPAAPNHAPEARGPFARIALFHPKDGHTVDFEAGYMRHLAWHQQAKDAWTWYGYTVTFGERQRWFVYASFGHTAAALDTPVSPAEDEKDNVTNVAPHVEDWNNGLYEYLPALSRGTGEPQPTARLELLTVDVHPGASRAFESALGASQSGLKTETLWYRMVAGGSTPRYVRLRPRPTLSAILEARDEPTLPDGAHPLVAKTTVEILTLRPAMSFNVAGSGAQTAKPAGP